MYCMLSQSLIAALLIVFKIFCRLQLDTQDMPSDDAQLDKALAYILNQFVQKYSHFCHSQHRTEISQKGRSENELIRSDIPEISEKSASTRESSQMSEKSSSNESLASEEKSSVYKNIGDERSCSYISSEINHLDAETKQSDEDLSNLASSGSKGHISCSTSILDSSESKEPISVSISVSGTGTAASLLHSDQILERENFHQSQQKAGNTQESNQKAIFADEVIQPYRSRGLGLDSRCVTQDSQDSFKRSSLAPFARSICCGKILQNDNQNKKRRDCSQRTLQEPSALLSQVSNDCSDSVKTIQKSQLAALTPSQGIQNRKNDSCNWSPKRFILKSRVTLSQASNNTLQASSSSSNQDTFRGEKTSCQLIKQSSKELGERRRGKQLSFMEDCQLTTLLRAVNHGHLSAKVICYKSHLHNYLCNRCSEFTADLVSSALSQCKGL